MSQPKLMCRATWVASEPEVGQYCAFHFYPETKTTMMSLDVVSQGRLICTIEGRKLKRFVSAMNRHIAELRRLEGRNA